MMGEFIKIYKTLNGYYVFDVNTKTIIKISRNTYLALRNKNPNHEIKKLKSKGYLSNKRIEKIGIDNFNNLGNLLDNCLSHLILQVTQQCNLQCGYCPYANFDNFENRSHSDRNMEWDTAKRSLDFFIEHSNGCDELNIGFYGGEPLLNFELIKRCVEYIKENVVGKKLAYNLTTNATLINIEQMSYFIDNNFQITLSIDGPEIIHDEFRRFPNGHGTFEIIIHNLHKLYNKFGDKLYKYLSINMVVVPNCNFDDLLKVENDMLLKNIDISLNFVDDTYTNNRSIASNDFIEKYNYHMFISLLKCFKILPSVHSSKLFKITEARLLDNFFEFKEKMECVPTTGIPSGPCIPGKRRLFVNVDGDFFPCEKVSETSNAMRIGNLSSGFEIDKVGKLINISQMNADNCKNCWAFMFCEICARSIDNEGELSINKMRELCELQRKNAMLFLREITLKYEFERLYKE